MKILIYIILAVFLLSILLVPLTEVFILGKDSILLSATIYNSFRAAREASYTYEYMRRIDAVVDEEVFTRSFADTFAASYEMDCDDDTANPLRFTSADDTYNDFDVELQIDYDTGEGDAVLAKVKVTAKSRYKYRVGYMRWLNTDVDSNPLMLQSTREFTMWVRN